MMSCAVILNAVKNLKVSVVVDGSTCLEILRYTQDDIEPDHGEGMLRVAQHDIEPTVPCASVVNLQICALLKKS